MATRKKKPTDAAKVDINVIAAVHHPLRRKLLELLALDGPATVSQLADASSQRIGNASHHLRVLGEAGLVEEAPELAKDRRETWWRIVPRSISWSVADVVGDPVAETVATAAEQQNLAHHVSKMQQWYGRRGSFDETWVRAAFSTEQWIDVTPEQLSELCAQIGALVQQYAIEPGREPAEGQERVFFFSHAVPATP